MALVEDGVGVEDSVVGSINGNGDESEENEEAIEDDDIESVKYFIHGK